MHCSIFTSIPAAPDQKFVIVPTFYKENSGLVEKENVNMAEKMRNFKDQKV
ncbi:hypothetical protein LEP1GSC170_4513 [Leptospira interrogans serovar Bataviae str. HAI135]|nr:hypothetical protein LEP1GSC170_4513 [Leptospira interrogans serovar Bataviae str. HAI135]